MEETSLELIALLRGETEEKYKKIGKIYCPALKSEVVFNSDGFHHLRYDGHRSERDKRVQKNKFLYLDSAVDVLKKATIIQEYRRSICPVGKSDKSGFKKTKIVEWFGFFAIISFSKCMRVKVVVRRIGEDEGKYHFWSVMPFWNLTSGKRIIGSREIEDG
jgi:hypothetical protein